MRTLMGDGITEVKRLFLKAAKFGAGVVAASAIAVDGDSHRGRAESRLHLRPGL
jgi:hypothetical protein